MTQLYVLAKPTKQHLKQKEEQLRQAKSTEEMWQVLRDAWNHQSIINPSPFMLLDRT